MAASEYTKQAIISSTKKLASEKPFQKISVIEIADRCGINRNTFYYYFADKYDVLQTIFEQEVLSVLETPACRENLADSVIALCAHMKQEQSFYARILREAGARSFRELLVQYYKNLLIQKASSHFETFKMESRDREIAARFYAHGTVGMICDWAAGDMRMDSAFAANVIQIASREKFFL